MSQLWKNIANQSDLVLVALVLGVLVVLFAPIPSAVLDFLILANFSFAFLILLLTFYMQRPVEFSTFPSLLLIATLFRLSLNVAATRLILSHGDAGRVISSIGSYVVGGNYVIGLIIFLILIVVQYVVITNGAQRVSEVAARFTLDSMPGQQMSIDADLNMGFITQEEAQKKRKNLEREAGFYGAMDGASKFVKGDAIAGIVIMLINIIGGLLIGVMQHGMPWSLALQTYTLLTIGDGIVTQVPALVIALGTGIIVTRSASDGNLSQQVFQQILSFPKTLVLVAFALFVLTIMPGIPALPAGALFLIVSGVAFVTLKSKKNGDTESANDSAKNEIKQGQDTSDDPYSTFIVEPVEIFVGKHWAEVVNQPGNLLLERISVFRKQHALDLGLVLPKIKFKDSKKLALDRYEIHIDGVLVAKGEARAHQHLAIHPSGDVKLIPGEITKDPTYGLPAVWIEESARAQASAHKFTLVDGQTVFLTHLTEVLRRESAKLLSRTELERMLEKIKETYPGLVEEIIPTVLSVSDIQKVLQSLLREKVSIRHLEAILETLADAGRTTKDVPYLTEIVRQRLSSAICQSLVGETNALHVMTLDPIIEAEFIQNLKKKNELDNSHSGFAIDPQMAEQFVAKLVQCAERMMKNNLLPVLLCSPEIRRHVRTLSERVLPHLRVLSMNEIPQNIELKSYAIVQL